MMTCDTFTNQELDQLYDLVRNKHDDVMRGDWEVYSFEDDLYEIIEAMEEIIYYDPTP